MLELWKDRIATETEIRRIEGLAEWANDRVNFNTLPAVWVVIPAESGEGDGFSIRFVQRFSVFIANRVPRDARGEEAHKLMRADIQAIRQAIHGWMPYEGEGCSSEIRWVDGEIVDIIDEKGVVIQEESFLMERIIGAYPTWGQL